MGASVAPGRLTAYVRGSRPRPYRSDVRLRLLTEGEWETFLATAVLHAAYTAALLDRALPEGLVRDLRNAGVPLLPEADEPALTCTCPDRIDPCKHTGALLHAFAHALDEDPFLLLLLRGRCEEELLDELTRRSARPQSGAHHVAAVGDTPEAAGAAGAAPVTAVDAGQAAEVSLGADFPSVPAATALREAARPPLPEPFAPPPAPGEGPEFPAGPRSGPAGGPEADAVDALAPDALAHLVADAAGRAHRALTGSPSSALEGLPVWEDAVRTAATHPHFSGRGSVSRRFARFAAAVGVTPQALARAAAAWRQGGPQGLAALEETWRPPAGAFDRGRSALAAAGLRMAIDGNRLPAGELQLRFGRDGRWYPYRAASGGDYWPEGEAFADPVRALTAMTGR